MLRCRNDQRVEWKSLSGFKILLAQRSYVSICSIWSTCSTWPFWSKSCYLFFLSISIHLIDEYAGSHSARLPQKWNWQSWKRNSARLPPKMKFAEMKTQFCETSSKNGSCKAESEEILWDFFKNGSCRVENEAVLRDLLHFLECWLQTLQLRTIAFCDFLMLSVESPAPATKKWRRVIQRFRSAAPATQHDLQNLRNQNFKGATPLTKWTLRPLSMNMSKFPICCPCHEKCSFSSNPPRLPTFLENIFKKTRGFWYFLQRAEFLALATKDAVLTLKSGPGMWESYGFDLQAGTAPQRELIFRHLNFQKRLGPKAARCWHFSQIGTAPLRELIFV